MAGIWLATGHIDLRMAGRIGMAVMLVFTAIGHFVYAKGMVLMMPEIIPFKKELVWLTGLIEGLAAAGLLIPSTVKLTAWLLILFFVLILPANISAARRHVDFQKGTYEGPSAKYLWFRIPLQVLFIAWVYFFAVH
jgi:uncharacterized membrane protein